ncbi:hypothetical protein [Streptomyces iconiensis]|uniref:Uncharacterized protein n=1 Tax=Streptomyces iconiensis TaxID=1384038 RepID=A0ABT6ZQA9_9ACTN|nr:hypothetical protein [Streptomyces iconiensis]MDJ1131219.1 hypothetical protein [Streptomyces iconiensis]
MERTDQSTSAGPPAHGPAAQITALTRAIAAATAITVYDRHGSARTTPSQGDTAQALHTATTSGSTVEEWHTAHRTLGQALTVVRVTHPWYGVDIYAIEHPAGDRIVTLLRRIEEALDGQDDEAPFDAERMVFFEASVTHGGHCAAVHEDVRDTLAFLGNPREPIAGAQLLARVRVALGEKSA